MGAIAAGVGAIASVSYGQMEPQSDRLPTMEQLETALAAQDWQRGDEFTWMILAAGMDNPDGRRFRQFPCDRLGAVDRAWRQASGDHFGFSVQRQMWGNIAFRLGDAHETRQAFDQAVGWASGDNGVIDHAGETTLPRGYWPQERLWRSGRILRFGCGDEACSFARTVVEEQRPALEYIFPRLVQCGL